jgi:hypothetical protein
MCNSSLVIKIPKGDKTGSQYLGPRTGKGLGYCAGYSTPGYTKGHSMALGHGYGCRGRNRGRGRRFYLPPSIYPSDLPQLSLISSGFLSPEEESKYLEQALTNLKNEIELIEKRIEEIACKKDE